MDSLDIVAKAREYIGVPFRHWGRDRNGVDCVGLVLAVAYELNLSRYVPRPYSRLVDPEEMRQQLELCCCMVPMDRLQPGDILFFRIKGVPQHLGIYTGKTLIHAYEIAHKVVEVSWGDYWFSRLEAAYRWKSLYG